LNQSILAASGAWVARYQVRQNFNKYRYYKLQVPILYFQCTTSDKLSKYKHLAKAATQEHIDAVMSIFRCYFCSKIQRTIHTLDNYLLDNYLLDIIYRFK
jgi:hypothetical protein